MSSLREYVEDLKKPEGQEMIKNYLEKFKMSEGIKHEELLFSAKDYIEWLEVFTMTYSSFTDEKWLYYLENISESDNQEVKNLSFLYNEINLYARNNYIYAITCDFGNYYKIKYNDVCYKIGVLVGQGTVFFCDRIKLDNQRDFIDFNDLLANKKRDNVAEIEKELNNLAYLIKSLYEKEIPVEAIKEVFDMTINNLRKDKESSPVRVLK